ncbi:MAG: DUF3461 family protein [Woeseiaceae bacterium]
MTDTKKSSYPTLSSMGVESLKQIDRYYVTGINLVDVLRIIYDRPSESFLASTRTYKFPRVQDNAAQGPDGKEAPVMKSHPRLRAAVAELDKLLAVRSSKENIAAEILREIELLEEDIAMRGECLKELARKIPQVG